MKRLLLFAGFLCWATLAGCAAVQRPIGPAQVTVLEEGRDYTGFSAAEWLRLKCQQRPALLPTLPAPPRKVRYGKWRWVIL
jgi:hypothetical protein